MTARGRTITLVAAVAAAAAAVVVGSAAVRSSRDAEPTPAETTARRQGTPPLVLDLGLREDAEADDLRAAEDLYTRGRAREAAAIFDRHDAVEARVGLALARWPESPDEALAALRELAREQPRDDFVRLHHGLALFWAGEDAAAQREWRAALVPEVDSPSALRAEGLVFPNFPRGRPIFVPPTPQPAFPGLTPQQQLDRLRSDAVRGGVDEKLAYGAALQRLGLPVEARAQYDRAAVIDRAALAPRVAAAVVRFTKKRPERAFARLGPLATRHPRAPVVQFHVGLLLFWIGDVDGARERLKRVTAVAPESRLGREANRYLVRLASVRSESGER